MVGLGLKGAFLRYQGLRVPSNNPSCSSSSTFLLKPLSSLSTSSSALFLEGGYNAIFFIKK
jgi:hypothetical protein